MNALILKTGRGSMDILNPTPEQVNVGDMLTNLSRIRRWCGASCVSVLQHQIMVADALTDAGHDNETVLAGLTHDLHEYVTGDIPAPLLDALWLDSGESLIKLVDLQAGVQRAVEHRIGVFRDHGFDPAIFSEIARADKEARKYDFRDRRRRQGFESRREYKDYMARMGVFL